MKKNVLYITYDGLLQPLGQSQVVNLILELSKKDGYEYTILSYEREEDLGKPLLGYTEQKLQAARVRWVRLRFTQKPKIFATLWNLGKGIFACLQIMRDKPISIVHARSFIPAMLALLVKRIYGAKFLFDMRGFWPDEKADVGSISRHGLIYKLLKKIEWRLLLNADHVVSLSHAGIQEMQKWGPLKKRPPVFSMITTCTDLERFSYVPGRFAQKKELVIGYVGTATGWYCMDPFFQSMIYLWQKAPEAKLLVINRYEQELFRSYLEKYKIAREKVEIKSVDHPQMPAELARMHAAIYFIHPMYSKIASAPTKLGELLACGIPSLTNAKVGDVKEILEDNRIGFAVKDFSKNSLEKGVDDLLELVKEPGMPERCANAAQRLFSLADGAQKYHEIYRSLSGAN